MRTVKEQALACRAAAQQVAELDGAARNALLLAMAAQLEQDEAQILAANAQDMAAAAARGTAAALLDRLRLDAARVAAMVAGVRHVAGLPDPVGQVTREDVRADGLRIQRVRVPLGVIAMIYEARPNVTADAAALCLKAGNGVILRGGSEAQQSNRAIAASLGRALQACCIGAAAVSALEDLRRESIIELLQLSDIVDLAIPRGGEGLIRFAAEHARVPLIKHYKGVCHLFVDASADTALALRLLIDGKTTRPAVCNALETLLVHADIAAQFLPLAAAALQARGVEVRACERSRDFFAGSRPATEADYAAEFLDLVLAVRVVDDLDAAIAHIRSYGSDHTEVIATGEPVQAQRFIQALRSAVIMVNASSRFSDGGELGLGAEIGISTTRLHAYGPMGAESLTIERYVVSGTGQVRHPQ
ncbi:glutamate-5-semialdehyde dehydrogenase [Tahibacter harae]|uniref:Gamma-glutamyl phosphate reductase n=1 Tax=Tahibacter harae TaxID=2963937 RepID=A0ABT1QNK7_9GAMM|nr:glutamate-5-semialdehyde dehydrogenase [Tahibacter harae]MCQ4163670.1 glutamate-5-semialdehyde dehydrogenase [Tahibacter harae]